MEIYKLPDKEFKVNIWSSVSYKRTQTTQQNKGSNIWTKWEVHRKIEKLWSWRTQRLMRKIQSFNSRFDQAEESESLKTDHLKLLRKQIKKKKSLHNLWDIIMGIPERAKKDKEVKGLFKEIMTGKNPNSEKEMNIQIHWAQRTPNRLKKASQRHIIKLTLVKDKETFESCKTKVNFTNKGNPIRLKTDFLSETLQASTEWDDIFQVVKGGGGKLPTKNTIPSKADLQIWREIRNFTRHTKAEGIHHHYTCLSILKGVLQGET